MENKISQLDNWVIDKIKTEYKDDVALLIGHNSYRLEEDQAKASFSFFFPVTAKAVGLSKTFIIDGAGYDLFPMSWERIERMAALDEDNASCVGDAAILYYRTEADKKRFQEIQARLKGHLKDSRFMINKALEKLDIAMGLYQSMMFEDVIYKLRKAAGHIVLYLSHAVAYSHGKYFSTSHESHLADLAAMKSLPRDFIRLYEEVVKAGSAEELKKLCYEMIYNTRQFLNAKKGEAKKSSPNPYCSGLADWYQELSYAWRQIYHWCDVNEPEKAFVRSSYLQSELDIVAEEFGLGEMDLMGAFNTDDLKAYRKNAEAVEKQILAAIKKMGETIETYDTVDDFLRKNG
jgi:hypothetical protein